MRLIIAGGGTGGHLFPGIAVAEEFLSRDPANQVLFVGSSQGIEARTIPRLGYQLELISAAGIKGKGSMAKLKGAAMLLYGYAQSRRILRDYRPDLVMGVAAMPRCRWCWRPVVCRCRASCMSRTPCPACPISCWPRWPTASSSRWTRQPSTFRPTDGADRQSAAAADTGTAGGEPGGPHRANGRSRQSFHLFVFGGSQGAHALNVALPQRWPHWMLPTKVV